MGCLVSCLRFKSGTQKQNRLGYIDQTTGEITNQEAQKNLLASAFLCAELEEDGSPRDLNEQVPLREINGFRDYKELKNEVKFLKACGAILESPEELRKAFEKPTVSTHEKNLPTSLSSLLHDASSKKFEWDETNNENVDSSLCSHDGPIYDDKSLCYEPLQHEESKEFLHSGVAESEHKNESAISSFSPSQFDILDSSTKSPYPTPLNLIDDMQTPGTVYPHTSKGFRTGRKARIRTQYIYTPAENLYHYKVIKKDDSHNRVKPINGSEQKANISKVRVRENADSTPVPNDLIPSLTLNFKRARISEKKFASDECSDSAIGPPFHSIENTPQIVSGLFLREKHHQAHANAGERPILGAVRVEPSTISPKRWDGNGIPNTTTKYKEDQKVICVKEGERSIVGATSVEPFTISHKRWDGNGIPNTTTKYKEDRRVSWHATPFEVRLEKAISDEKHLHGRKLCASMPLKSDEQPQESSAAVC